MKRLPCVTDIGDAHRTCKTAVMLSLLTGVVIVDTVLFLSFKRS